MPCSVVVGEPKDRDSMVLRNVCILSQHHTASEAPRFPLQLFIGSMKYYRAISHVKCLYWTDVSRTISVVIIIRDLIAAKAQEDTFVGCLTSMYQLHSYVASNDKNG